MTVAETMIDLVPKGICSSPNFWLKLFEHWIWEKVHSQRYKIWLISPYLQKVLMVEICEDANDFFESFARSPQNLPVRKGPEYTWQIKYDRYMGYINQRQSIQRYPTFTQRYCWCFRNPIPNHLGCEKNFVNDWINYLSLNWLAGFLNHQQ